MTARWRTLWFVVLAVILVIGIDRVAVRSDTEHLQAQEKHDPDKPLADDPGARPREKMATARFVPLYAAGDLFVRSPPKPKKTPKKAPETKPEKSSKANPTKPTTSTEKPVARRRAPSPVSRKLDGDRPQLEVAYDEIGFPRYLDVIERVGRLFVLVTTEAGPRLGPEISLKRQLIYPRSADMSILAVKRPHLVSDERILGRLEKIAIPKEAIADSVVLILTKPFDSLLWDTITETLKQRGLRLDQVSRIKGGYVEGSNGVFLRLDSVEVRATGKQVRLDRKLRVSL